MVYGRISAAKNNLTTAFNDAAGRSLSPIAISGNIGGFASGSKEKIKMLKKGKSVERVWNKFEKRVEKEVTKIC